jgi:cytochrome c553
MWKKWAVLRVRRIKTQLVKPKCSFKEIMVAFCLFCHHNTHTHTHTHTQIPSIKPSLEKPIQACFEKLFGTI